MSSDRGRTDGMTRSPRRHEDTKSFCLSAFVPSCLRAFVAERRRLAAVALLAAAVDAAILAQGGRTTPKFYPDDPIAVDDDSAFAASGGEQTERSAAHGVQELELAEAFDFLENTFGKPGDRQSIRAVNVNTLDEVPDSSWFTNRIGVREMTRAELQRGPNKFERLDAEEWIVSSGKGPGGFHPGFRAVHPGDPEQIYQLEVDPIGHPQLATSAEFIGTLIYHALGYHVVDVNLIRIDPKKITISPKAMIRDASGRRKFTQADLDAVLRVAARDAQGRVYFSASRFEEGKDIGHFTYHGTRPDDPNDIHPHEHRRELRANRVFSAWLNHDDSRAVNSLNMLVNENGRTFVRHYMYDFGAILGSATRFPDTAASGHEFYVEKGSNLRSLGTLGLSVPHYARANYPDMLPSAGFVSSVGFDPVKWKANYPNAAFDLMRPDDAFWGARLVSKFTDDVIGTIVDAVGYDDGNAAAYLKKTIAERRDIIMKTWLVGVNPIVDVALAGDGTLTFANAAVNARVASAPQSYVVTWSRFDNPTGVHTPVGSESRSSEPRASAPAALLQGSEYVSASIRTEHADFAAWKKPVQVYFRRDGAGWKTIGMFRDVASIPKGQGPKAK